MDVSGDLTRENIMKKVVILGGGFAGLEAAIFLRKKKYTVTLVSDRNFFFIYPTSIWVPTRDIEYKKNSIDLAALQKAHGFELVIDEVACIHARAGRVELQSGHQITEYDYLILAIGMHKLKLPGIENTLSICGSPQSSLLIRDRLDQLVAKGSGKLAFGFAGNPKDKSAMRGGPAFEILFNVHNMLKKKGLRDNFELTFFAPMEKPGARMGEQALGMLDVSFTRLGIHRRFGKKINRFEKEAVIFADDSRLEADFIMFIPGGTGHSAVLASDLPTNEAGFVQINDYCQVIFPDNDGPDNIYAVGDVAALEGPKWRAKQGHLAEVMARNTAFNIIARDKGQKKQKGYQKHINILCVMDSGDGAAFVYRDTQRGVMFPMPYFGHWVKKSWCHYCRLSKLGKIPRIPCM